MLAGSYQEDDGGASLALRGGGGATPASEPEKPRVTCRAGLRACAAEAREAVPAALLSSFQNRYLAANVVYFCYATGILYIDLVMWPNAWTEDDVANVNRAYLGFGCLHIINALLYIWSWLPLGFGVFSAVQIPEWSNVLSACLYVWTATLYAQEGTGTWVPPPADDYYGYGYYLYDDPVTWQVHKIETSSAFMEMIACFGWVTTWWLTYPRYPGRGWTWDDPDAWANVLIVVPSFLYVWYNFTIIVHPEQYAYNDLYVYADILYWVGAVMYLLAALRDDGWFWWAPTAGECAYGCDRYTPLDPAGTGNLYGGQPHAQDHVGSTGAGKGDADLEKGGSAARGSSSSSGGRRNMLGALGVAVLAGAGWLAAGVASVVALPGRLIRGRKAEGQALMGTV